MIRSIKQKKSILHFCAIVVNWKRNLMYCKMYIGYILQEKKV